MIMILDICRYAIGYLTANENLTIDDVNVATYCLSTIFF